MGAEGRWRARIGKEREQGGGRKGGRAVSAMVPRGKESWDVERRGRRNDGLTRGPRSGQGLEQEGWLLVVANKAAHLLLVYVPYNICLSRVWLTGAKVVMSGLQQKEPRSSQKEEYQNMVMSLASGRIVNTSKPLYVRSPESDPPDGPRVRRSCACVQHGDAGPIVGHRQGKAQRPCPAWQT